jgi:hypothetical protein
MWQQSGGKGCQMLWSSRMRGSGRVGLFEGGLRLFEGLR